MKPLYHLNNKKQVNHIFVGLTRIVFKCSLVFCLFFSYSIFSQTSVPTSIESSKTLYKVWAEVVNGDTVPSIRLQDVWVYAEYSYKNKKQYEAWSRTKYNVKKVYPYAILAAAKLKEYNLILENMPDEKTRKVYMKTVEKELKAEFEEPLKDLTITQGKILLKLIDRETGNSSYELVKDLRGGFQAFMWQSLARLFGSNMKSEYDPKGEDIMTERAIKLIEAGQF
ncbi:MAG: DUF4294 domain-containing protein [Burkholderiales bacterium]|nr:DUF4294 domain-containing protein [Bacteroidia bacterium]